MRQPLALRLRRRIAKGGGSIFHFRGSGFSCFMDGDLDAGQTIPLLRALKDPAGMVNVVPFVSVSISGGSSTSLTIWPLLLNTRLGDA